MFWSVRFILVSTLLNALWPNLSHTKPSAFWPRSKHLHCIVSRVLSLWLGMDSSVELKIDISMNLHFKRVRKKSLHENEGQLCLVPYCTEHRNIHLRAFLSSLTVCTWTHLPQHPENKPALSRNTNIIMRLKPKQCLKKYDTNCVAQGLHPQQELFEKKTCRKWNLLRINKIKMTFTYAYKNGWMFFKLVKWVDGFILKCVLFISSFYL